MTHNQVVTELARAPTPHRIVIVGGPQTGKSTFAHQPRPFAAEVRSSDELVGVLEWSEASAEVAHWFNDPGPWIIEGVATARALRKWLAVNPDKPLNVVVVLMQKPFGELTKGQAAMGTGVATVWNEIAADVLARGAKVLKLDGTPREPVRGTTQDSPTASALGSST
jgi:hypothetical protein